MPPFNMPPAVQDEQPAAALDDLLERHARVVVPLGGDVWAAVCDGARRRNG